METETLLLQRQLQLLVDLVVVVKVKIHNLLEELMLLLMDDHQRFRVMLVVPVAVKLAVVAVVLEVSVKMVKHQVLAKVVMVA